MQQQLPPPSPSTEGPFASDQALAGEIIAGSVAAWHRFIDLYGPLLLCIVRRHWRGDEDEIRSIFVDVLAHLYRRGLKRYQGRASLATWLVFVTRGITLDHVRRCNGRSSTPRVMTELSALDREVFELRYRRSLGFDGVLTTLRGRGRAIEAADLYEAMQRIERLVHPQILLRFAYRNRAASIGASSGRLLEFLDQHGAELERQQFQRTPLQEMIEREARARSERILAMVQRLPDEEREAVLRHVMEGHTAQHVAADLGLRGRRRLYTIVERALRRLRRWVHSDGALPERSDGLNR